MLIFWILTRKCGCYTRLCLSSLPPIATHNLIFSEPTFVESQSALRRVWINAKLVRVLRVWYTTPLKPDLVEVPPNPVVKWTLFEAEILVQKTGERVETFTEVIRRALIDLEKLGE
jgi:hypothetical protein